MRTPEEVSLFGGTWRKILIRFASWLVNPVKSCHINTVYYESTVPGIAFKDASLTFRSHFWKVYKMLWRKPEQRLNTVPLILSLTLIPILPTPWAIIPAQEAKESSFYLPPLPLFILSSRSCSKPKSAKISGKSKSLLPPQNFLMTCRDVGSQVWLILSF